MGDGNVTRVHWRSPQVLLAMFACLVAAVYAIRSGPPPAAPAPTLTLEAEATPAPAAREVVLYAVDEEGLARPIVRELPAPDEASEALQIVVDALRDEMVEAGSWPPALPAPTAYALTLERTSVAVLDVPENEAALGVAGERAVIASLERTLLEYGVERIAFLRDGRAVPAWLGTVAAPNGLE